MSGPRLLLSEHDADTRENVRRFFEARSWTVVVVESAADAMRLASTESFAAAVIDIGAAPATGLALLRLLRARRAAARIVVTLILGDPSFEVCCIALGASALVGKPYELDGLARAIEV